jgi:hypothetical protein
MKKPCRFQAEVVHWGALATARIEEEGTRKDKRKRGKQVFSYTWMP